MANTENSRPSEENYDPAAQEGSRNHFSTQTDEAADLQVTLARAEETLALISGWLVNLQALARLEFSRSLDAGKRLIALSIALIPLVLLFYLSLCLGVGLAGYYFSQSIYIGFAAFLTLQVIVIGVIALYQKKLRSLLGFSQTREQLNQAKEALSDVFKTTE